MYEVRVEARLTQRELAERANTSQPAIARLEASKCSNASLASPRRVGAAVGRVPVVTFKKAASARRKPGASTS